MESKGLCDIFVKIHVVRSGQEEEFATFVDDSFSKYIVVKENRMSDSEKKKRDIRLSRSAFLLSGFAGVVLLILLISVGSADNAEVLQSRTEKGYIRVQNYICREIEEAEAPIGVKKEYSFTLDKTIANDMHLAFYTVHQYVGVWLDGEKVYSLKPSEEQQFSRTVGSNWVMIPLYREDAGKEVRIEIIPVYESFRSREVEFLIGSQLAIYKDRLTRDLPQLILGVVAVFSGVIFVCAAGYIILKKHRGKSVAALGIFSLMMGVWRLADTRFTPFIFPKKPVLLFYISVAMLMIGIVPLMKWIEEYYNRKSRFILNFYCIVASVICLIQLFFQFFGILDLRDTLFVTHIEIAVGVAVLVGTRIYEQIKCPKKMKISFGIRLMYLCMAGVIADVAAYYIKGNSSGLLFSLLTFFLYIVFTGIATMFHYSEQEVRLAEKKHQLAEKEHQLAESRITTMMSQIRTHFIFNVLTAISGYCKYDAKKADDALICFSRYLRRNISIMEEEGLILFSKEQEYLEDYISLEKMRFQDIITFEKKIEEQNFKLPPFILQPIVENAIKHGLVEQDRSGTVTLHTMRDEKSIIITIKDNGAGFSQNECEKEGSVGIKNVRFRLENMVKGSLLIESVLGEGTTVTIRLPVEETEL